MRRALLLTTITVAIAGSALLQGADDFIASRFGDYLDALRTQAGIPGLAAVLLRTGEQPWERAYGRRDVERAMPTFMDTPFELDGTTQIITAAMVLQCVEEGRLLLDDRLIKYSQPQPGSTALDGNLTIRQALSHTTQTTEGLVFTYRPDRLNGLAAAVTACRSVPFPDAVARFLDQLAMYDSLAGADYVNAAATATTSTPPTASEVATLARYNGILEKLAKPYAVDSKGRTTPSVYTATKLTPASGLISTARDLTFFDAALRKGQILKPETLAVAWTPPADHDGLRLPHGLGWFVQQYNGERVVWQFGVSDNVSSSMIIAVPGRGLTLILLANSQGLARPFSLQAGDVMVSPFARVFLSIFVR